MMARALFGPAIVPLFLDSKYHIPPLSLPSAVLCTLRQLPALVWGSTKQRKATQEKTERRKAAKGASKKNRKRHATPVPDHTAPSLPGLLRTACPVATTRHLQCSWQDHFITYHACACHIYHVCAICFPLPSSS